MRRFWEAFWNDNNLDHLARRGISQVEVEDILFGIDGEDPDYVLSRDGDYFTIYGQTGKGRLLKLVGELREDGRLRVFSAIDMDAKEKRLFQKGRRM